jgi:hypothetical protein
LRGFGADLLLKVWWKLQLSWTSVRVELVDCWDVFETVNSGLL